MKKYLHIGCGDNLLPKPFINIDARKKKGAIQGKVYPLNFKSGTFDLVYASHVLEHFKKALTSKAVKEWVRVLKPGGTLRLSVPCFKNISKIYNIDNNLENVFGPLMGGQTYKENFHYNIFDKKKLEMIMTSAGCEAIHPWDFKRTSHSKYWDFSQATTQEMPISINLEGRKKISGETIDDLEFKNLKLQILKFKKKIKYKKELMSIFEKFK